MADKLYILDTSVWMADIDCLDAHKDGKIVVPYTVLEELDYCKDSKIENKRYLAVHAIKRIKEGQNTGQIRFFDDDGVKPANERVDRTIYNDLKLIEVCKRLRAESPDAEIHFMTNDINLYIRANQEGLQPAEPQYNNSGNDYTGFQKIKSRKGSKFQLPPKAVPNQFFIHDDNVYREQLGNALPVLPDDFAPGGAVGNVFGTVPLNDEQMMALNLLLDPSLSIITIAGKAGSGKTLLATAAGLHMQKKYTKLVLVKPIIEVGKEMGFLPGDVDAKIGPHITPYFNSIETLCFLNNIKDWQMYVDNKVKAGELSFECISYFRGITIQRSFLVIDEAQNLTEHEMRTILTRAGNGTKVILLADVDQIDNKYLSRYNNGFSLVCNRFYGQLNYGHITLQKSERSELAEQAARLLA